jgi:hypothetical protein
MSDEDLEIISGSLTDPNLESLSREVWLKGKQLLRLGRYKKRGWRVTIMDDVEITWEDFSKIVKGFEQFIPEEEEAIKREEEDFRRWEDE